MGKRLANKLLLVGWDAADWKVIKPLLDQGKMPALESVINNGVMGKIATLDPPLSPMLWTSIASGKRADKHGILGFVEPDPVSLNVRPVRVTSRKVKAIWNILTQHNLKTHVVGWWPSHPAEPINGVCISNFFQKAALDENKPWVIHPGTVHPQSLESFFSTMRIHPQELTEEHLLPFIPNAAEIDQEKNKSLASLAKITAENASIHAAATWVLENQEWDFASVYYDGIDHYCHGFMKFYPPKRKHVPQKFFELYKDVVAGGYIFHDMMLERLLKLAGDDATVMIVSDHGFHSDHLRPVSLPKEPAAPAIEHSPYGIICIKGPGIKKDELVFGASILDVTPTILTMFGLPVGNDMDGKPLTNIFSEPVEVERIESWESVPGNAGMHPPTFREDTYNVHEEIQQLEELGYIEKLGKDQKENLKKITDESRFYLSRSLITGKKYNEAIEILEQLFNENPDVSRYASKLAQSYLDTNQPSKCMKVLEHIRGKHPKENQSSGLMIMEASILHLSGNDKEAYAKLQEAEILEKNKPHYFLNIGKLYLMLKKYHEAERLFSKELKINPDSAAALHGLGVAQLRTGKAEDAVESLLKSISLMFNYPIAHLHLGEALMLLGNRERAKEAFTVCHAMAPQIKLAKEWLDKLNTSQHSGTKDIAKHESKDCIIVVSGLPRSGTSMMMNMLEHGGIPAFKDNKREADTDNPRGYFEHEAVKNSRNDNSWAHNAKGKAVKVISNLLFHLPHNYGYKVIFMQRDLEEVLASQEKMLQRQKRLPHNTIHLRLEQAFLQNLNRSQTFLLGKRNMQSLYVQYNEVLKNTERECNRIAEFLNLPLDITKMKEAVEPDLNRNRKTKNFAAQ